MESIIKEIQTWPFLFGFVTLYFIVFLRAGGTYLLGRAIAAGTVKRKFDGPRAVKAIGQINRWGPGAVMLSFLTVGIQTVINLAAGVTRMSPNRYLLGLIPGAGIWAMIWTTIGMSAFVAVISAQESNPLGFAIALFALATLITVVYLSGRAGKKATE